MIFKVTRSWETHFLFKGACIASCIKRIGNLNAIFNRLNFIFRNVLRIKSCLHQGPQKIHGFPSSTFKVLCRNFCEEVVSRASLTELNFFSSMFRGFLEDKCFEF